MTTHQPHVLDKFAWESLSTHHRSVAIGTSLAKRYPGDAAVFAALGAHSAEAIRDLSQITAKGDVILLAGVDAQTELPDWTILNTFTVVQMVCEQPLTEPESSETILDLTPADLPDIQQLREQAQVGSLLPRAIEIGRYVGIRKEGQLVAMAGETCYPPGYHEISGVCTHPDTQGRGYARLLISRIAALQQRDGDTPFLHTGTDNERAIRLYEWLGFQTRCEVQALVVQR